MYPLLVFIRPSDMLYNHSGCRYRDCNNVDDVLGVYNTVEQNKKRIVSSSGNNIRSLSSKNVSLFAFMIHQWVCRMGMGDRSKISRESSYKVVDIT